MKWKRVYSSPKPHLATLVQALLLEHGFEAVIIDKKDSNYLFGFLEVHVPEAVYDDAALLIEYEFKMD
jgi:hypothetical protein